MRTWKVVALVATATGLGFVLGVAEGELPFTKSDIVGAEKLAALEFTDAERDSMQADLADYIKGYEAVRGVTIANSVPPALVFHARPSMVGETTAPAPSSRQRLRLQRPWR